MVILFLYQFLTLFLSGYLANLLSKIVAEHWLAMTGNHFVDWPGLQSYVIAYHKYSVVDFYVGDKGSHLRLSCSLSHYVAEAWTLNGDLKSCLDAFGTMCLHRILGYCWDYFMQN